MEQTVSSDIELKYTYEKSGDFYAGYLNDYPEFTAKGENLQDFEDRLWDIYDRIQDGTLKPKQYDISDIRQNLDEISQVIAKTVPVEAIYLFGSYAYGTPNKDSDVDLFVIFKDEMAMRELDAITEIHRAIYPIQNMPTDILGLKYNRFHKRKMLATLERKIEREGVKLYG